MAIIKKTKNRKRSRAHGFLARKSTTTGRKVIANRRKKGRKNLITV